MKRLLILLCLTTVVSCGIKNKFLNSSSDELGVPKQQFEERVTSTPVQQEPNLTQNEPSEPTEDVKGTSDQVDDSTLTWYYALPFVGLGILVFLVYRLKKLNMVKSVN